MATITLSVQTAQGTVSVANTVADSDVTRAQTATAVLLPGRTNQQLLAYALKRLLDNVSAMTKNYERSQDAVADIPIT